MCRDENEGQTEEHFSIAQTHLNLPNSHARALRFKDGTCALESE